MFPNVFIYLQTSKNSTDTDEESTPKRLFSEDVSKSDNQKTPSVRANAKVEAKQCCET